MLIPFVTIVLLWIERNWFKTLTRSTTSAAALLLAGAVLGATRHAFRHTNSTLMDRLGVPSKLRQERPDRSTRSDEDIALGIVA